MSRKRKAPKRFFLTDAKYKSDLILKLMNSIMYDGKKTIAEKIVYDALDKLQSKSKEEPIKIFNVAINNIKPTIEVRSRRVGGATYQVPVEVKQKRSQALAIRWLIAAAKKRKATKRTFLTDTKYKSDLILKLMNSIMYDVKKTIAEKIVYYALDKLQLKVEDEPMKIFNTAINNIKPTIEVRSRRVGGATYQVPVEVKANRSQALAIRWLINASRKRKDKKMSDKIFNEIYDAYKSRGAAIKKKEDTHRMAESNKAFAHFRL